MHRSISPKPGSLETKHKVIYGLGLEYEVEYIVNDQLIDGYRQYLVKWKGYDDFENTWEPEENLQHCEDLIEAYYRQQDIEQYVSTSIKYYVLGVFNFILLLTRILLTTYSE